MNREPSPVVVAGGVGDEARLTEIPQRFLMHGRSPSAQRSQSRGERQSIHESMRNDEYERRIGRSAGGRPSSRFRVPVDRPLPLRPAAHRATTRGESSLAALFRGPGGEAAPTPDFLRPQDARRREIEERHSHNNRIRNAHAVKQDAAVPKRMPNLARKVNKDFVPRCAEVPTKAKSIHPESKNGTVKGNKMSSQSRKAWV